MDVEPDQGEYQPLAAPEYGDAALEAGSEAGLDPAVADTLFSRPYPYVKLATLRDISRPMWSKEDITGNFFATLNRKIAGGSSHSHGTGMNSAVHQPKIAEAKHEEEEEEYTDENGVKHKRKKKKVDLEVPQVKDSNADDTLNALKALGVKV